MSILLANLLDGFNASNGIGKGIVIAQFLLSIYMIAIAIGKFNFLRIMKSKMAIFLNAFSNCSDILEYYITRRPDSRTTGLLGIYAKTCERLLKVISPESRKLIAGRASPIASGAVEALTSREIELVRGTCEHLLDEEERMLDRNMTGISSVVALSPMLGLLGTVWGVLDAFAEMGTAGSANLATIAPAISSALVTTVVGLLIAIPGVIVFDILKSWIRDISMTMEAFADELMGRIACEFQGRSI